MPNTELTNTMQSCIEDDRTDENVRLGTCCNEYNAVVMVGRQNGRIESRMLWFDRPGRYFAKVVHDGKPVPEGYTEAARFEGFVDTITVNGHGALFEGKEILFYRKDEDGCIVTVKHEERSALQ